MTERKPSLINLAYTRFVYPLVEPKAYRGLAGHANYYRRLESASQAGNAERQWNALRGMLQHGYQSTPFYRRRFEKAGIRPEQIASPVGQSWAKRFLQFLMSDLRTGLAQL